MGDVQIQVLAKAVVLGTEIDAGYCRRQIKVKADNGDKETTQSILVVYGKANPTAEGLKLTELVNQCKTMVDFFNSDQEAREHIVAALPPQAAKYLDSISFQLKEVFFVKPINEVAKGEKGENAVSSEFAFWFDISFQDMTAGWPITVKNISIKLWKTTNPKILEEMNVSSMAELLGMATKASDGAVEKK